MNQELIGKFISSLRKEKGLTQEELANMVGVTPNAIGHYENGRRLPDYSIIESLCKSLGITVNDLFNGGIVNNKEMKKVSDDNIINIMKYENKKRKKYKRNTIIACFITILVIFISFLLIYFINNYNKIHVYEFVGLSDKFSYNGTLIESNIKHFYYNGGVVNKDSNENKYEIIYAVLRCDDTTIITASSEYLESEDYGYEEIFSDYKLNNLDKWNVLVYYYDENNEIKEEVIKLKYKEIMNNKRIFSKKIEPISDNPDEDRLKLTNEDIEKYNKNVKLLLDMGFKEYTPKRKKEANVIFPETASRWFERKNSDGSYYNIKVYSYYGTHDIKYSNNLYSVIIGNKLLFDNYSIEKEENKWSYEYDYKNDLGSCKKGKCPDNFIREARSFYERFKTEFKELIND